MPDEIDSGESGGDGDLAGDDLTQVEFPAGVVNVNAHEIAVRVIVQNHACGNLLALGARTRREVNVERIRFWIIIQFHGLNLRSKNALCIVTLSASVTTRKKRP